MKRGISLIVISVSAIVVLTLLGVITFSLIETSNKAKKIQFAEEIEMVQIAVKSYYNINKEYPVTQNIMVSNILQSSLDQFEGETKNETSGEYVLSIIDYQKAGIKNLKYGNSNGSADDVYAVSLQTGKVYYAKGLKIGSKIYYTKTDEISNLINDTGKLNSDEYTRKAILYNEQEIEVKSGNTRETQKRITLQVPKVYEKISVRVNSGTTQVNSSSQNENYYIYIIDVNTSSTIFVEYSFDGNTLKETYNVSV